MCVHRVLLCLRVGGFHTGGRLQLADAAPWGNFWFALIARKYASLVLRWVKKFSKLTEETCVVKSELYNHRWFPGLLQSKLRRKKLEQWEIKLCWGEFRQKFDNLTKCHVSLCYSIVICLFWLSCPLCESTVTEAETYTLSFGHWFVKYLFNRRQFFPIDVLLICQKHIKAFKIMSPLTIRANMAEWLAG